MIRIEFIKGKKGPEDNKIRVWDERGFSHDFTYLEYCQIGRELFENEEKIYPQPRYFGKNLLLCMIYDTYIGLSDRELLERFIEKTKEFIQKGLIRKP